MIKPLLTTIYLDGRTDFGSLFSVPDYCRRCQEDAKCIAFRKKLTTSESQYSFHRCPYGFASCSVMIDGKVAIVCGLNVKNVSPKKKHIPNFAYLPALPESSAIDLVKKNVNLIETVKDADKQRMVIPTLIHGLSKILDRARTQGEYLLASDSITDWKLKKALTAIAVSTIAATVVFYSNKTQAQNAVTGAPRPIDIYGKFFKMRKLLENCGGSYKRIDFEGAPQYFYNLYFSFEAAVFQLLENANKYTPEGGSSSVHFAENEDGLVIEIKNVGPHLSKKELEWIKKLGCRGNNAKKYTEEGSGIGLASVNNIADVNGIVFSVASHDAITAIDGIPFSKFVASLRIPIALRGDKIVREQKLVESR